MIFFSGLNGINQWLEEEDDNKDDWRVNVASEDSLFEIVYICFLAFCSSDQEYRMGEGGGSFNVGGEGWDIPVIRDKIISL